MHLCLQKDEHGNVHLSYRTDFKLDDFKVLDIKDPIEEPASPVISLLKEIQGSTKMFSAVSQCLPQFYKNLQTAEKGEFPDDHDSD